ncbi:MAG TPA: heavy metal-associated domain-containing protein [Saprospiraceae bacterium]|nr:heavy metal-associated domain-containing protein [Saprospiraceae bacterium]
MKPITHILYSIVLSMSFLFGMNTELSAQKSTSTSVTAKSDQSVVITLLVPGICDDCKARIESAAMDVAGVKKAEWDIKTDTLVVIGSAKMDKQKIADALAKAGYRSELAKADPKGYKKLPACCQYDSGIKEH